MHHANRIIIQNRIDIIQMIVNEKLSNRENILEKENLPMNEKESPLININVNRVVIRRDITRVVKKLIYLKK